MFGLSVLSFKQLGLTATLLRLSPRGSFPNLSPVQEVRKGVGKVWYLGSTVHYIRKGSNVLAFSM